MNKTTRFALGLSLIAFTACSGNKQADNSAEATSSDVQTESVADASENSEEAFAQQEAAAKTIFEVVLNNSENEEGAISYCTESFLNALKALDEFEDGNPAWYALRTMEQEGTSESKITKIEMVDPQSITVEYLDMGYEGSTRLNFVKEGETWKVNSATVTYQGSTREIQ